MIGIGRLSRLGLRRFQIINHGYSSISSIMVQKTANSPSPLEGQRNIQAPGHQHREKNAAGDIDKYRISGNIAKTDKVDFLVKTLRDIKNSKEAVYSALDAWVAWEENFPIALLKGALLVLEKEQEWHRVVQVIKWMLSKGQGTTMGTYGQLILALDMDNRADEAHEFWDKKIGGYYHSVPWQLCRRMIAIYYRNNMLDKLVELFEELEAYDRKPPEKSIVLRVANAYEALGRLEDKERILEKYNDLFSKDESPKKKSRKPVSKKNK
ncbi:pentatricopeptide repeat-containing protein At4g18975, chloroplastic [Morus notabilis]|uniref:pentatricopeptide repeat-containing protein At4g18975, chloroplastic n=1 Tax=Morus notabilis TaxID=981085 RepID=UPI000CED60D1|nr:pentatricopeptide repeat-containing protein At4g18975, chloroplastic [Morus notabilis]XP_024019639.1 pentatricopeptide repeat-containing protein At4g18975, chloroplastic [Morus notabilis]